MLRMRGMLDIATVVALLFVPAVNTCRLRVSTEPWHDAGMSPVYG
jgi:hypothetical protein